MDKDEDNIIDAVIEESEQESSVEESTSLAVPEKQRRRKRDIFRESLQKLAELSLLDYQWRSSLFKSNEADRRVEESLARMMGEDPSYVRPMDASTDNIGPLGVAESKAVKWLAEVIEEEGKRAKEIADSDGELKRPSEVGSGPLANLEKRAIEFIEQIRREEAERVSTGTLRPKDLKGPLGPLGEAENKVVAALEEIIKAEKMRVEKQRIRGGDVVRPIDVPGPLGELELKVSEIIRAEKQRRKEREMKEGKLVRPKDAKITGPMGDAERKAVEQLERVQAEEKLRLQNLQRVMEENRPMEKSRDSVLGVTEAFVVGIMRAPKLFANFFERVKDLLKNEEEKKDLPSLPTKDTPSLPPKGSMKLPEKHMPVTQYYDEEDAFR